MPSLRQLEFAFRSTSLAGIGDPGTAISHRGYNSPGEFIPVRQTLRRPRSNPATDAVALQSRGRDLRLEAKARKILQSLGATKLARALSVEWNSRLKTAAGRADYRSKLISLNPHLVHHPAEIDRTLHHELAHILAQFRAGRRRILPHGVEWREACRDLGISDEKRCHNLPFPVSERTRRYLYRCPHCQRDFPRVRRIKRAVACLACCRAHYGGKFDARFRLRLVDRTVL
jgi:predicted SprT family Zn-dependent metalloprotease